MVRKRVYRDDMPCPRCGSNWLPKYGNSKGKQTYRCGQCLYHFIPGTKRPHQPEKVKSLAVDLYAEGLGIPAISRVLKTALGTVYSWVKKSPMGRGLAAHAGAAAGGAATEAGSGCGHPPLTRCGAM